MNYIFGQNLEIIFQEESTNYHTFQFRIKNLHIDNNCSY